jgi:hypothetical protein
LTEAIDNLAALEATFEAKQRATGMLAKEN